MDDSIEEIKKPKKRIRSLKDKKDQNQAIQQNQNQQQQQDPMQFLNKNIDKVNLQKQVSEKLQKQANISQQSRTEIKKQNSTEIFQQNMNFLEQYQNLKINDDDIIKLNFKDINIKLVIPSKIQEKNINDRKYQILNIQKVQRIEDFGQNYQYADFYRQCSYQLNKQQNFTHFRIVRDGNCYYRSVGYAYIEKLVMTRNQKALIDLMKWVQSEQSIYKLDDQLHKRNLLQHLQELVDVLENRQEDEYLYNFVQKMFVSVDEFDKSIIYMIRCVAKNFILQYKDRTFNETPIEVTVRANFNNLQDYIDNILMKMEEDAQGPLLFLMPIIMRINIYLINLYTNLKNRDDPNVKKYFIEECKAQYQEIQLKGNDALDLHNQYLYVLRKDGHYDILYHRDQVNFNLEKYRNQQDCIFKQIQVQENQQEQLIKVQCCNLELEANMMKEVMLNDCIGQDIFNINRIRTIPKCVNCQNKYQLQDLIAIFKNHIDEQQIRQSYLQIEQQLGNIGNFNQYQQPINQNQKCVICNLQIDNLQDLYKLNCGCTYHTQELIDKIRERTEGTYNLDKKTKQINFVCFNTNCQFFPPMIITIQDIKQLLITAYGQEEFDQLQKDINQSQIQCCNQKLTDSLKKQVMQNFEEIKGTQQFKIIYYTKMQKLIKEDKISFPLCICDTIISDQILCNILKIEQQELTKMKLFAQIRLAFKDICIECLHDYIISQKQDINQIIYQQIKIDYLQIREGKIEIYLKDLQFIECLHQKQINKVSLNQIVQYHNKSGLSPTINDIKNTMTFEFNKKDLKIIDIKNQKFKCFCLQDIDVNNNSLCINKCLICQKCARSMICKGCDKYSMIEQCERCVTYQTQCNIFNQEASHQFCVKCTKNIFKINTIAQDQDILQLSCQNKLFRNIQDFNKRCKTLHILKYDKILFFLKSLEDNCRFELDENQIMSNQSTILLYKRKIQKSDCQFHENPIKFILNEQRIINCIECEIRNQNNSNKYENQAIQQQMINF